MRNNEENCLHGLQCLSSQVWVNRLPLSCYEEKPADCLTEICKPWKKVSLG